MPDINELDALRAVLASQQANRYPQMAGAAVMQEARGGAPLFGAFRDSASVAAATVKPIGKNEIAKATDTLNKYKQGKKNLEKRIIDDEMWWELRHWEAIRGRGSQASMRHHPPAAAVLPAPEGGPANPPQPLSASAWLFNALTSKHADAMDNFPEAVALPREQSDEESAKIISSVLPVVMEQCDYEQTYNDEWWKKLMHGTSIYSPLWNPEKENGIGDIDIGGVDILKLFWEPGIEDFQDSHNMFLVELVDDEDLEESYPRLKGKLHGGKDIDVAQYVYNDSVDTTGKSVVVDWYYKKRDAMTGKTLLHYVKYVGDEVLFASENEPEYAERGWYDHGEYPFYPDVLFPEAGTPIGFGYIAICRDPQIYIDKLFSNVLETSCKGTKRRYFASDGVDCNEAELLDENKPIVHVTGPITEDRLREIVTRPLDSVYLNVIQLKIDEMNRTANNRDVSNGGTAGGVTAASAIAALQEAGNKTSRDMISASYRTTVKVVKTCIELMRQFYTTSRTFRITNEMPYEYAEFTSDLLAKQETGTDAGGNLLFRSPTFDIKVVAQKKNPFSRAEQNERAKELYGMGFFNPQRAQEALLCLDMMDFEGIEKIKGEVSEGMTLYNMVQQLSAELQQTRALLSAYSGIPAAPVGDMPNAPAPNGGGGVTIQGREAQAQAAPTPMMMKMAARANTNMNVPSNGARPQA